MGTHSRSRPRTNAVALAVVLVLLVVAQATTLVLRGGRAPAEPAAVAIAPSLSPTPTLRIVVTPSPSPSRTAARKKPQPPKAPTRAAVFGGLGAWIDVYDFHAVAPADAVSVMATHGVRTLYIQTGRYNTKHDVAPEVGPWLVAAHRRGVEVVGWYLPGYKNVKRDIDRTLAIARYRYRGEAFDGLGIDIEEKSLVRHVPTWNARVADHADAVRAALRTFPVATITPTPIGMAVAPARWAGFPWERLARASDALMLMSYWSYRDHCPDVPEHCAYGYTLGNIRRTRALTKAPALPIHIIGGVADLISTKDVADFVRAARSADAYGASLYDFRTTHARFWALLERLAR